MTKEINDGDHVSRYCPPSRISTDGIPLPKAFKLRDTEEYLSVYWLEYFKMSGRDANMTCVREAFAKDNDIASGGRFAVLNVGSIKRAIKEEVGRTPHVKDLEEDDNPSHASIGGYPRNNVYVPIILSEMVRRYDMYPGRI